MADPSRAADRGASAQQVAEAVRDALRAGDRSAQWLGLAIEAVGPGHATLAMVVRDEMLNGHATCHGGLIATLADSAFAYACNAYNEASVASGFDIQLMAPARAGDRLVARAVELHKGGRTGVYDVTVTNQHGTVVAALRGRSHTRRGHRLVEALPITAPARGPAADTPAAPRAD